MHTNAGNVNLLVQANGILVVLIRRYAAARSLDEEESNEDGGDKMDKKDVEAPPVFWPTRPNKCKFKESE